jgi:hypothetical protein
MDKHKQQFSDMRNPAQKSTLWKSTLKQRCMARMKDARGDALKKAREEGTLAPRVRDVMEDELRRLKSARDGLGFVDMDAPDTFGEEYIDVMRMLEQELMDELRQQEAEMLAQYESVRQFDEAELQDSLARHSEDTGNAVPCRFELLSFPFSSPLSLSIPLSTLSSLLYSLICELIPSSLPYLLLFSLIQFPVFTQIFLAYFYISIVQ